MITTPHNLTQLITDPGWERLARLLTDPQFCSEIVVGETPDIEQQPAKPARRSRSKAKTSLG